MAELPIFAVVSSSYTTRCLATVFLATQATIPQYICNFGNCNWQTVCR